MTRLKLFTLCGTALLLGVSNCIGQPRDFNFGPDRSDSKKTYIRGADTYSREKGYGFEPGVAEIVCPGDRSTRSGCSSDRPFYFTVGVPEGNYRVTLRFGDRRAETSNVIKAELRRLILERVDTKPGEIITKSFIVNVRTPQISAGSEVKLKDRERTSEQWAWDEKLTLEFNGTRPSVQSIVIQRVDVPTVFILGDSTVCDQPGEPYASWGQMITRFFGARIAVANHAESGESLRSSLDARRLDKVLSVMKRGDFLLIQYGHNDEKEKGDGVGAFTTYKASLRHFVAETRKKGGVPILVTPMHRRTFDDVGTITNSHGDYPEAVRQVAKEEKVPLIDLTALSKDLYEALGKEGSAILFKEGDGTHHNNYGAYQLARAIVQAIRDQKLSIAKYLMKDLPKYDPKHPDSTSSFLIPPSPGVTNMKPLGN